MGVLREECEKPLQEDDKLARHFLQFVKVTVGVDIAEACSHGVIDKQDVCKLVPRALIVCQLSSFSHAIRSNLHERTIFGTAARPTIDPYHRARLVCQVAISKVPEEQIPVVLW